MRIKKLLILISLFLVIASSHLPAGGQGSRFVISQLKFPGNWDPYPGVFSQLKHYLTNTTSIRVMPQRRVLEAGDKKLFYSPFIIFTGKGAYPPFSSGEIRNLKRYIRGGGLIMIDSAGDEAFKESVNRTMKRIFPDKEFTPIPDDHAVFRSFYLVKFVSGRHIRKPYLEGIEVEGRVGVILSENDIWGAWQRDRMGNFAQTLLPGRPGQRKEAVKLALNIAIYSVCGTYKSDPVHIPHIERKLGR